MDDPGFCRRVLGLTVHDLRNAVNSVQLAVHVLRTEATPRSGFGEYQADLAMLDASVLATRSMIEALGAYTRTVRELGPLSPESCSARRLLDEAATVCARRAGSSAQVDIAHEPLSRSEAGSPEVPAEADLVRLDPILAARALEMVMTNAITASRRGRIRVESRLGPARWRIDVVTPDPPAAVVEAGPVDPSQIEHLTASPHERRTLDLALAGWISQRFGGVARLEVDPGRQSWIALDWPRWVPDER